MIVVIVITETVYHPVLRTLYGTPSFKEQSTHILQMCIQVVDGVLDCQ